MDINTYQYKELAEYMDAYLLGLVEYAVEKQLITALQFSIDERAKKV